jgi:hypothetical protein
MQKPGRIARSSRRERAFIIPSLLFQDKDIGQPRQGKEGLKAKNKRQRVK